MGWYAMAIVDCLDYIPAEDPNRPKMITILNDLAAGLADFQDPATGMWWQIVNKGYPRATYPDNYTESSCTAMFSYALGKAVEKGYIPSDPYLAVSRTGFEGLVDNKVSFDGSNLLVLIDTVGVGSLSGNGNYAYYVDTSQCPRVTNDYKGVGALMRAALQYEKPLP
jgi:unsaturated rhamnogalacturonyl hydrolase